MCATQSATDDQPPADPLSAEEMLKEETEYLQLTSFDEQDKKPWALCLSGGGIRSATFCLGAIQGLAKAGLLDKFTYLSTVSGGGYIGSWLSRWMHEAGGIKNVQDALARNGSGSSEPPQVKRLRAYSNYLSPHWGLSGDLFCLVSIVLRNLLLNWLVLLPLIVAFVLLPYIYIGFLGLSIDGNEESITILALAISAALLTYGNSYMFEDMPAKQNSQDEKQQQTKGSFGLYCATPIVLACILLSLWLSWISAKYPTTEWTSIDWRFFAGSGASIFTMSRLIGQYRRKAPEQKTNIDSILTELVYPMITGSLGGLWFCQLAQWIHLLDRIRPIFIDRLLFNNDLPYAIHLQMYIDRLNYPTMAVPALLISIWLATTIHMALTRKCSSESRREWLARSGGWWISISLIWLLVFVMIIIMPQWILSLDYMKKFLDNYSGLSSGAAGGGLLGLIISLAGYWSRNGSIITGRARKLSNLIGIRLLEMIAIAFITLMLLGISFWWNRVFESWLPSLVLTTNEGPRMPNHAALLWSIGITALLFLISIISSYFVGTNTFSLHSMYGNRLARAYLGAARNREKRHPHWFTGFDEGDNVDMAKLKNDIRPGWGPLHVLNLTLNMPIQSNEHLEWQQRKAASFTVTPLHSGSKETNYRPSKEYAGEISLARAMTISGAAASPNMGYHSSPAVRFVMTLFNVRLGWWLPNPGQAGKSYWKNKEPDRNSLWLHISETFGISKQNDPFVNLSDGGHFENLGLYEMVRRRCRKILVLDASSDPEYCHQDLQDAIRKIRIDFGVSIEFPDASFDSRKPWIIGTIYYPASRGNPLKGTLCYVKPAIFGNEPLDVQRYAKMSQKRDGKNAFPHQSTSDQFFDEEQFESYRMLGYHMIRQVFPNDPDSTANWPIASAPTKASRQDEKSSTTNSQEEEIHLSSGISNSVQNLTRNATLASALAAGGILGVSGTVALKETSIEVKPGAEISISKESLANLRESMLHQHEPPPPSGDPLSLEPLEKKIEEVRIKLESVKNSQASIAEAINKIPKNGPKDIQEEIQVLQNRLNLILIKIGNPRKRQSTNQQIDNLWGELQKMEDELKTLNSLINDAHPRHNVHGIEGVKP